MHLPYTSCDIDTDLTSCAVARVFSASLLQFGSEAFLSLLLWYLYLKFLTPTPALAPAYINRSYIKITFNSLLHPHFHDRLVTTDIDHLGGMPDRYIYRLHQQLSKSSCLHQKRMNLYTFLATYLFRYNLRAVRPFCSVVISFSIMLKIPSSASCPSRCRPLCKSCYCNSYVSTIFQTGPFLERSILKRRCKSTRSLDDIGCRYSMKDS